MMGVAAPPPPPAVVYGATWDGSSSTVWTRTDAAAGFANPTPAVANGSGSSPFDNIMPWSGMVVVNDPVAGELVKIPKYWYKLTKSGDAITLQIANEPGHGFSVSPAHSDRGDGKGERDYVYVGRYHCAEGYKSTTGVLPKASITRSAARTGIHGLGTDIWQWDWAMNWTIKFLYLVEYANWNSQSVLGYGTGNGSSTQNMGYTDAMAYHTGTSQAARTTRAAGCQYRHIEGLWDNVYDWVDGCYNNSSGLNVILNPSSFSDSANGTLIGLPVDGYPSKLDISTAAGFGWCLYPTEASGSESTYLADKWYFSGSFPCLRVGGNYYHYDDYGLFYVYYGNAGSGSVYVGCRLQKLP